MPDMTQPWFTFTCGATGLAVAALRGVERMNQPYRFEVDLVSADAEVDEAAVLEAPATLRIHQDAIYGRSESPESRAAIDAAAVLPIHGIVTDFEIGDQAHGLTSYRAVLQPRLWLLSTDWQHQVYLDQSIPAILAREFQAIHLAEGDDYEFRLRKAYGPWEYVCQYHESSLDFCHRLMERDGLFYFFEQTASGEKLIVADHAQAHPNLAPLGLRYAPDSGIEDGPAVRDWGGGPRQRAGRVTVVDYNYRTPDMFLRGAAEADPEGAGESYLFGDHFKTVDEAGRLATLRAETALRERAEYGGVATASWLRHGHLFALEDPEGLEPDGAESFVTTYLLTEVVHEGRQPAAVVAGMAEATGADAGAAAEPPDYVNRPRAIPASTVYRPSRTTPKPRLPGPINGIIDLQGVDDQGRYKVRLPFERGDGTAGKVSRWCRMAKPYTGDDYGMHLPLHQGTEVLLTCTDGDPDRPVITGAMENPRTPSQTDQVGIGRLEMATNSFKTFQEGAPSQTPAPETVRLDTGTTHADGHAPFAASIHPLEVEHAAVERATILRQRHYESREADTTEESQEGQTRQVVGTWNRQHTGALTRQIEAGVDRKRVGEATYRFVGTRSTTRVGTTYKTYLGPYRRNVNGTYSRTINGNRVGRTVTSTATKTFHGKTTKTTTATTSISNQTGFKSTKTFGAQVDRQDGAVDQTLHGMSNTLKFGFMFEAVSGKTEKEIHGFAGTLNIAGKFSLTLGAKLSTIGGFNGAFLLADLESWTAGASHTTVLGAILDLNLGFLHKELWAASFDLKAGLVIEKKNNFVEMKTVESETDAAEGGNYLLHLQVAGTTNK